MPPQWLTDLAIAWILTCVLCALVLVVLEVRQPPQMRIMAIVWPVTALYYGPVAVWAFFRNDAIFDSTTHCGAGCTLGDVIGEWWVYAAGFTIAGSMLFAEYAADFALAYILGIAFQYFAIAPMRGLGLRDGIVAALKADTLSLIAFELGLFGWMALTHYVLLPQATPASFAYWFMMQVGMIAGFWTSYPMNVLLLRWGIKEPM